MLQLASSTQNFPLTLTLSLREREQQAPDWSLANGSWANSGTGVIERRWTILPLPKGEGWGEGEQSVANLTVQSVTILTVAVVKSPLRHFPATVIFEACFRTCSKTGNEV